MEYDLWYLELYYNFCTTYLHHAGVPLVMSSLERSSHFSDSFLSSEGWILEVLNMFVH